MSIFVILVTLLATNYQGHIWQTGRFEDRQSCERHLPRVAATLPPIAAPYKRGRVFFRDARCIEISTQIAPRNKARGPLT